MSNDSDVQLLERIIRRLAQARPVGAAGLDTDDEIAALVAAQSLVESHDEIVADAEENAAAAERAAIFDEIVDPLLEGIGDLQAQIKSIEQFKKDHGL